MCVYVGVGRGVRFREPLPAALHTTVYVSACVCVTGAESSTDGS